MTQDRATWIFQANPGMYDIYVPLRAEAEEYWNCNQHHKKIRVGDRVLIWISGKRSGIYAVGTVLENPVLRSDSAQGQTYWTDAENGRHARPRALIKYERVFLEKPLLKDFLQCDPELWGLSILAYAQGTNFPVKEQEWQAIEGWLEDVPA